MSEIDLGVKLLGNILVVGELGPVVGGDGKNMAFKVASPSDGAAMLDLILLHLDYSDFRPKTSLGICHCYQLSNIHLLITHDFKSDTTATF